MLAVDTNVIVRYVTRDHTEQSPRAKRLVDDNRILVLTTVLLETEWVLRSVYGYNRSRIAAALRGFAGLPRVMLESPEVVATALEWLAQGMDFADALHLAASENCDAFISFDRHLARRAASAGAMVVRAP